MEKEYVIKRKTLIKIAILLLLLFILIIILLGSNSYKRVNEPTNKQKYDYIKDFNKSLKYLDTTNGNNKFYIIKSSSENPLLLDFSLSTTSDRSIKGKSYNSYLLLK
ncbi:MAG: hypothetical protein Q8747_00995 [Candidatus Phytoplasma australasiaticum]|uniref:Effector n=1 Tax=Sesame phyllody phytoplasma TaxID=420408 RepID=A0ABS9M4R0_9MOLU|nr:MULTISPECIES: hypothetical protein [Phytoplasma]MCG3566858.1 hypothetical protein [Sesame phyllody phytoplasma]MDO8031239.1 hypothetical protein [Candidatus Phytoplasma australasiaticum]MDO8046726.1 hypothetical protein [Candidatus Phytoplasma australasiaticum]MDO8053251.1 hypothetical protein [Candidatus Phytoplasma australasiaticum]MDO8053723.1 hypothetical protein [Candidatus Phytoplasma australasiaticum]